MAKRIIVGISGATGVIYGIRLLQILRQMKSVETHLVATKSAKRTIAYETNYRFADIAALSDYSYDNRDIGARLASGSFCTDGMIITPCTVKTLSEIANGITESLISRAADVILKERRRLLLLFRETPLHLGHIENMAKVTKMGGIIAPPLNAFYNHPSSIDDLIEHTLGRSLDLLGIETDMVKRWQGA